MNLNEAIKCLKTNGFKILKEGLNLSIEDYKGITTYWIKKLGGLTQEEAEIIAAEYSEDIYNNYDAEVTAQETAQEILDSRK